METFHSRMPVPPEEKPREKKRIYTHGERSSMVLASCMLLYSIAMRDLALTALMTSFLLFMLRPLAEKFAGEAVANGMKGMAMSLGIGSIILAFF